MAEQHPINGLMGTSMEKIRELVDVNTIIGDPITSPDGTIIIPVSKVSFGFVAGGSDLPTKAPKEVFAGGSGAGITINPQAFIVVQRDGDVKMLELGATAVLESILLTCAFTQSGVTQSSCAISLYVIPSTSNRRTLISASENS